MDEGTRYNSRLSQVWASGEAELLAAASSGEKIKLRAVRSHKQLFVAGLERGAGVA